MLCACHWVCILATLKNILEDFKKSLWNFHCNYATFIDCFAENLLQVNIKFINRMISQSVNSVAQSRPTLCNSMNRSTPGLPVHHQLPEFTQTHVTYTQTLSFITSVLHWLIPTFQQVLKIGNMNQKCSSFSRIYDYSGSLAFPWEFQDQLISVYK